MRKKGDKFQHLVKSYTWILPSDAWLNKGLALKDLGRLEESEEAGKKAKKLRLEE